MQAGGDDRERGLPIGNLTSQWFANLTLGRIDRLVVEQLRMPGVVAKFSEQGGRPSPRASASSVAAAGCTVSRR